MATQLPKEYFSCNDYFHPDHLDFDYFALRFRSELTEAIAAVTRRRRSERSLIFCIALI
jgi:hypothetical protein